MTTYNDHRFLHRIKSYILIPVVYLIGGFFILYHMMGNILFQLNDIQLDRSGDGFKNYFAFAWQYKNEDGLFFSGMQYPYGDLLAYADGQPLFSLLFVGLKKIGLDLSGYELFIVQGLPILGIAIGFFFLHKIIRHYNIPIVWTIITVIACTFLSPQIFRFNAHFGLAYIFCFSSIWHLYIKYQCQETKPLGFYLSTSILLFAYAYLHPYHLLIGSIFLLAVFAIELLNRKLNWVILASSITPLVLFLIVNNFIDPYIDRPKNPFGAWQYKTEFSDLVPFYGWYKEIFTEKISVRTTLNEGYGYLGILMFLFPFLWILKKSNKSIRSESDNRFPTKALWASILVLAFAMGLHLLLTNHRILDWIPSLRQFRALGRFVWPFYYVGFISLSIFTYRTISQFSNKYISTFLLTFIASLWAYDGLNYTQQLRKGIQKYSALNQLQKNKDIANALGQSINIDDYQAILPIPVSTEGAEKFFPQDSWFTKTQAMPFAYQSGLPIIGAYMSRTSLSRILRQHQISSSRYVKKDIIDDLPNKKKILSLIADVDTSLFSDIIERSTYIARTHNVNIYSSTIKSLSELTYVEKDSLTSYEPPISYNNFENDSNQGFFSEGSGIVNGKKILADINTKALRGNTLNLSVWRRIDDDDSTLPLLTIILKDDKQNTISDIQYRDSSMKRMEVINDWVQLKYKLTVPKDAIQLIWSIEAEKLHIDHSLISRTNSSHWIPLSENRVIYNHYIAQSKTIALDSEN